MRVRRERVAQEHDEVDTAAGDERAVREIAAERARLRLADGEREAVLDQPAGRLGGDQARDTEHVDLAANELEQLVLLAVVRDQCDLHAGSLVGLLSGPSPGGANRGEEVVVAEGFGQVRGGAGIDRAGDELLVPEGGQHHDRDRPFAHDLAHGVDPVQPRHLHVDHGEVGCCCARHRDRFDAVTGLCADLEAGALEQAPRCRAS